MNRLAHMGGLVALLLAATLPINACTPANAEVHPPGSGVISDGPDDSAKVETGKPMVTFVVAKGDTLNYKVNFNGGFGSGSSGAQFTVIPVAFSTGGWTRPIRQATTTALNNAFALINTSPWDSVQFTMYAWGTGGSKVSTDSTLIATWKVLRGPNPPPSGTIDSSLTQTGLLLKPDSVKLFTLQTAQFCGMIRFADGKVALRSLNTGDSTCVKEYGKLPSTVRSVTFDQQVLADAQCINWSATGGTITSENCSSLGMFNSRMDRLSLASYAPNRLLVVPRKWRTEFNPNGTFTFVLDPKGNWNRWADALAEQIREENDFARRHPSWLAFQPPVTRYEWPS